MDPRINLVIIMNQLMQKFWWCWPFVLGWGFFLGSQPLRLICVHSCFISAPFEWKFYSKKKRKVVSAKVRHQYWLVVQLELLVLSYEVILYFLLFKIYAAQFLIYHRAIL